MSLPSLGRTQLFLADGCLSRDHCNIRPRDLVDAACFELCGNEVGESGRVDPHEQRKITR